MQKDGSRTFNYAIGMFGTSIPINLLKTYAAIYYVDTLGLKTTQWALVLFIYTFIDVLDNPVYGFLSDRTRTKWGRRRPWLVIGTPLLVLGLIAFFSTPEFMTGNSLLAYAMLFYMFTGTLDSVINANYGALFPELFTTDGSRAKANALRQAFQLLAMIISIALTPIITDAIGFSLTSIIYGVVGGVVIIYMAFTAQEREIHPEENKPKLWDSIKTIVTNFKFWIAGFTNAFYSAAMSLVMAGLPFFAKYTLGISSLQQTMLFGVVLLIAVGCVALWAFFVRKFGLIPVWRMALISLAVAFIPLYFANTFILALIFSAMVGFGFAGVITTMDLISAKIMDEDTHKYNLHREGIYSNALGFMNRLSGLFVSLAFLLLASLFGFESGNSPGSQPGNAARFLMTVFPFVMMLISIAFSFFINFNKDEANPLPIETESQPELITEA